jgi:uncharacterized surface protein with fasciclin (FAS1) repeats
MQRLAALFSLVVLLVISAVPSFAQETPGTIADIVVASASADEPEFTTLLAAVSAADPAVLEALSNADADLTVFAPTDAAFAALAEALGEEAFNGILADTATLTNILLYHVVAGSVYAEDVVGLDGIAVETLYEDYQVNVSLRDGAVYINDSQVIITDIEAANGVIHVIDAVLVPSEANMMPTIADVVVAAAGSDMAEFTTLLAAVSAADPAVLEALSNADAELTVFAPTDAAFAALVEALGEEAFNGILEDTATLTNILLYHVLSGEYLAADVLELDGAAVETLYDDYQVDIAINDGAVFVNDAQVIMTDIETANGIVHVIDAVLVPSEANMMPTIAEVVVAAAGSDMAEFTTLLAAVSAADPNVLAVLSDAGAEVTVFAPTDAAFAALVEALGEEAFNGILADQTALTNILLYHVVAGEVLAADVVALDGASVDTLLADDPIAISIVDGNVFIDEAQVIMTDIATANGIIHVIDAVLVPNGM